MKKKIKIFIILIAFCFSFPIFYSLARENVYYWYIDNFETEIVVKEDSSLLITEKITADCGNAADKHGIFRVLPTQIKTTEGNIKTPIKLISIADFNDKPLKYSVINDSLNKTITWKIGDPNRTVKGINYYKIIYEVKNAIRFKNLNFNEFYWNLNGNFWDLETDNFMAKIIFPEETNQQNSQVDYYTGLLGGKSKDLADYEWISNNILQFTSRRTLLEKEGITVSVTFPKGIFFPYEPSFMDKYGNYLWFLIPLAVFMFCFKVWKKYGQDPEINKTIIPEYGVPENLSPIEVGMLLTNGRFKNDLISAAVISFAVKGLISIEEMEKKFLVAKDFRLNNLTLEDKSKFNNLTATEKILFDSIFEGGGEMLLSSLRNNFYIHIPKIKESAKDGLINKGLITEKGLSLMIIFLISGIILPFVFWIATIFIFDFLPLELMVSLIISSLIMVSFSFFMPKRTQKGAELLWKIMGLKMYMETAEKYRQQFYEKQNIFEKLLPYAMVFGMTGLWIKKMKEIYGEEYLKNYHPVWYVGTSISFFSVESFNSTLNGISSSISSNVSGPSGAGGSGGAGGGGGGGGGGGW